MLLWYAIPTPMTLKDPTDSGRLFRSSLLEALSKNHISIPVVLFLGTTTACCLYSSMALHIPWGTILVFAACGLLFFTLTEYLVHRYVYHMESGGPTRSRVRYLIHGVHHDHPRDKRRLALPPVFSFLVSVLFVAVFRLLLGVNGYAFGGGFLLGYTAYLSLHYLIHVRKPPRNFLSAIWRHHNLHHFVDHERAFGVSSPLWDLVFGTMPQAPGARG